MYKIILIILLLPIESVIMSPLRPDIGIHVFFFFFIPFAQCYWRVVNFITFFKEPASGFIFFYIFYFLDSYFDLHYSLLALILGLTCSSLSSLLSLKLM